MHRPGEGIGPPGAQVTGVVSHLPWVLELNSSPLAEQQVLLIAEPSGHPYSNLIVAKIEKLPK